MNIRFTKPPAGKFGLAYFVGEEVDLPEGLANEIISTGWGEMTEQGREDYEIELAIQEIKKETPETNKRVRRK